jgi:hypothetical protein
MKGCEREKVAKGRCAAHDQTRTAGEWRRRVNAPFVIADNSRKEC